MINCPVRVCEVRTVQDKAQNQKAKTVRAMSFPVHSNSWKQGPSSIKKKKE